MKKLVTLIFILALFMDCGKTYCPGFPDYLYDYLPYPKDTIINFRNSNFDTLSLDITFSFKSDSYTCNWNEKCACGADAGFKTILNELYLIKIEGAILLTPGPSSELILDFYNSYTSKDHFNLIIKDDDPFEEENEFIFGDTVTMVNDYSGGNRISEVMIVKGIGLISFNDKIENCIWELIE